jgi:hypothetical protein
VATAEVAAGDTPPGAGFASSGGTADDPSCSQHAADRLSVSSRSPAPDGRSSGGASVRHRAIT